MLLHLAFISVQEFPLVLGHFSEISPEFRSGPARLIFKHRMVAEDGCVLLC